MKVLDIIYHKEDNTINISHRFDYISESYTNAIRQIIYYMINKDIFEECNEKDILLHVDSVAGSEQLSCTVSSILRDGYNGEQEFDAVIDLFMEIMAELVMINEIE